MFNSPFRLAKLACILYLSLFAQAVHADCPAAFGNQTIRWLVPDVKNSTHDQYSRAVARAYARALKAEVLVENHANQAGNIKRINQAFPDGTLMGSVDLAKMLLNTSDNYSFLKKLPERIQILGNVYHHQPMWVVNPDSEIKKLQDLLDLAKLRPIRVAVDKIGNPAFLSLVLTAEVLEIEIEILTDTYNAKDKPETLVDEQFDVAVRDLELVYDDLESGEITALLQVSTGKRAFDDALTGIPWLVGHFSVTDIVYPDDEAKELLARNAAWIASVGMIIGISPDLSEFNLQCAKSFISRALGVKDIVYAADRLGQTAHKSGPSKILDVMEKLQENTEVLIPILSKAIRKYM